MTVHLFRLPAGSPRLLLDVPDDVLRIELAGPPAAPEPTVFERPEHHGPNGTMIWRPLTAAALAVAEAERASHESPQSGRSRGRKARPAEPLDLAGVGLAPCELWGIAQPHRSWHFLLRCAHALKPGEAVALSREQLLAVLIGDPA